jgi:hypothetical protein
MEIDPQGGQGPTWTAEPAERQKTTLYHHSLTPLFCSIRERFQASIGGGGGGRLIRPHFDLRLFKIFQLFFKSTTPRTHIYSIFSFLVGRGKNQACESTKQSVMSPVQL